MIPNDKYNTIQYIGNYLGKKIAKILPSEFSVTQIFKNTEDIVFVDIGSSHISIVIKKGKNILGLSKIPLGMNDLIKNIQKKYKLTRTEIIANIDSPVYLAEKQEFLTIFDSCLITGIEEIIHDDICPHRFFLSGGGNNAFLRQHLASLSLGKHHIRSIGEIELIQPELE